MELIRSRSIAPLVVVIGAALVYPIHAPAAEPSPAKTGKIIVRVVDGSGAPQAGAVVKVLIIQPVFRQLVDIGRELHCDATGRATFDRLAMDERYLLRATVGDRLVGYDKSWLDSDTPTQTINIRLSAARSATIRVRDEHGNPIAGTTVAELRCNFPEGPLLIALPNLPKFGVVAGPTNTAGELTLRMLPEGPISVELFSPKFAPADIKKLATEPSPANDVVMSSGVKLELRFRRASGVSHIDNLILLLDGYEIPLPPIPASGKIEMTLPPGNCPNLSIRLHPDFTVTPGYFKIVKRLERRSAQNVFTFDVRKTTKVRGRVVDRSTGKPLSGILVRANQGSGEVDGPFAEFASKWTSVALQWTDEQGRYELALSAGPAQVSVERDGMTAEHDYETIDVAAEGSTVVPDIVLRPTPKIRGIVRDPAGQPVPHAVVRFRNSNLIYTKYPIVADSNGRFELAPQRMPTDWTWQKAEPVQTILAFDPYRPLGAVVRVDLANTKSPENIDLQLKPQDSGFPVVGFPDEFASFKSNLTDDWRAKELEWTRGGAPAPELDGALWLNTPKPKMSLADFRGKYLLLHFWTTWCGNCPKDMQHLIDAVRLYRARGLAVVCVHDNSVSIAEIKQYVAQHKINLPVLIDQPDGRILAGYKPHGAIGYPTDVLVGPDSRIVGYPPGSQRVIYRIELLRQQLMSPSAAMHGAPQ